MKNILNQPMRSRMSRCFQRRKWESLFKKFKKNGLSVKPIQSQRSKKIEEVNQQMADFEKKVTEKEQR